LEQQAHGRQSFGETATVLACIPTQVDTAVAEPEDELVSLDFNWLTDGADLIRATRLWIQYGLVGFTIFCILVGAVEALFGR
jgi:hypothetical protein